MIESPESPTETPDWGRGHGRAEGEEPFVLKAGELVLFRRNDLHLLGSDLELPPVPARDVIQPARDGGLSSILHGGDGARSSMVCGFLGCDDAHGNPVISALPAAMRLSVGVSGAAEWIRSTFQYAAEEVAAGRPGSSTVLAKLSELLFVEAVRRYAKGLRDEETGWLAGRFTRLIGVAPMRYLANWRMQVAAQELRKRSAPLVQVANKVGYESEAAFSRAFKKSFGAAPATWRRSRSRTAL